MFYWISVLLASIILAIVVFWKLNYRMLRPDGKCVLITGCDSGIGLTLAIVSHSLGLNVIATCLSRTSYGAELLNGRYPNILIILMDVTKENDVKIALGEVENHLAQTNTCLWALINNAGVMTYGHFDWQTESQVINQVQINFIGVWRISKCFLPLIRKAKGRIINITSTSGYWSLPGLSIYCGTKHAIEGFSNSIRAELIPWNVKVILLNPGNMPKNTQLLAGQKLAAEAMKEEFSGDDMLLYSEYFERFQQHLETNFGAPKLSKEPLNEPNLNKVLESCLLLQNPSHYYSNLTIGFRFFVLIFKILPTYYADWIFLRIFGHQIGYKLV